jgi:ferritin-like metal-binding protein YciE
MPDDKNLNTVQQYVGDMVALESHIEEALDRQLDEVKDHPEASAAVHRFHTMVRSQRDTARAHLQTIGGSESHPVKSAVAGLFGAAAGVIDSLRTKPVSKCLRDDYTAFNLAAIGYAMLHTTAHLLGQQATADLAERHLRGYAGAVQEINQLIANVVAWELRKEGHAMDDRMVGHATETLNRVWRETAPSYAGTRRAA